MEQLTPELELKELKAQADTMGITYSPNIGLETLRNKIKAHLEPKAEEIAENQKVEEDSPRKKALKLIRCRIINRDPAKNSQDGTLITCSSTAAGIIVRKWIPFHGYENGYHIPQIIYDFLKTKKYLSITPYRDPQNPSIKTVKKEYLNEYDITVLPNLTQKELEDLAEVQRASGLKN